MKIQFDTFSLIPPDYKKEDPRGLLYLYPNSLNIVAYARKMQQFSFYQSLQVAETLAKRQGYILLPWSCIHWKRAKTLGHDRKIKIGRKSYFLVKVDELTSKEETKLNTYLEEMNESTG
ncbi:hypothetical protein KGR20_09475 [Cytobacillus oceanisediminis]|uniref:hypothetical protein n=1 Tax=Bacillaceae TaxID=186817 RepID=UPI000C772726|nr:MULTISPECIES: hypothetical protein [Bacillaceae]MBQ6448887.1 hypothetical protein [Bacillus sp. (in: firmicutes)]MBZ9534485.1 hypothetical protein [Cytobacillus oceanisediminis]UTI41979.1 hypothetical protein NKG37_24700 [Niallia sp. RD1]